MEMKVNREAYRKLIDEDIEWILKQPRSLEREHIVSVLKTVLSEYTEKKRWMRLNCLIHLF